MNITIKDFGGIVPSLDEFNLPSNGAQSAKNVDLSGGTLRIISYTENLEEIVLYFNHFINSVFSLIINRT